MPGEFEDQSHDDAVDDAELQQQTQSPSAEEAAAIAEATRKGWVPKEEFTGDEKRWVDAKTFLERGERFNKNLQREVQQLKQQLADFEGTKQQFIKFHEQTLAAKQAELDAAISALRVQKSQATADHEHEQAIALEDRIDLLKDQKKALAQEAEGLKTPTPKKDATDEERAEAGATRMSQNAAVEAWVEDGNEWFRDDPKLRAHAVAVTEEMIAEGEKARGRKLLDLVAQRVRDDFPRSFKGKPQPTSGVESGSGGANGGKGPAAGKSERDLPPADRAIMKDLIAGGYTTKEKFLESYFSRA